MFVCRLFHADQPFEQLEERLLEACELTIGRAGDWPVADTGGLISRVHCTLSVEGGRLMLRDKSSNGTFLEDGCRAPFDQPIELLPRQSFRLGRLSILVDRLAPTSPANARVPDEASPAAYAPAPSDWVDPPPPLSAYRDASLVEAFCQGAGLDASALSSQDPADLMRHAGEIYRQTVLGLATLMAERARVKGEYELERTTIGPAANNPFKWTPTRKLAQDLLCGGPSGFLAHAAAVRASFDDLGRHMAALTEGASQSAQAAIEVLAPDSIDEEAKAQGALLRSKARWEIHHRRYASLSGKGREVLKRAFSDAYCRALDTPRG